MSLEFETRGEWLSWRNEGIGASDVPIILGLSKYKKPFQLFQLKTGRVRTDDDQTNFAASKGIALEPVARKKFAAHYNWENDTEESFPPSNIVHPDLPFMRASLDGISNDGKIILEIKYQGKDAHADVLNGKVSDAYFAQIQTQLMIARKLYGTEKAYLCSIGEDQQINVISIFHNDIYQESIVENCSDFWSWVQANRWPGESIEESMANVFEEWQRADDEIKRWQAIKDAAQQLIFESGVEVCGQYNVRTTTRKGNVKYADIPQLDGLDLEQYRGKDTVFKTIVAPKTAKI